MKIATIASTDDSLLSIKDTLEKHGSQDQYVFLERRNMDLAVERVDLFSTNILILDAAKITSSDLSSISTFTRDNPNPAVIFASGERDNLQIVQLMRAGVSEVISWPIIATELLDAIERLRTRRYINTTYHARGKILSFLSSKGGAGATFISSNLGYSLANSMQKKVLLIDLHIQFGDAAIYMSEIPGQSSLADIISQNTLDSSVIASATMQISDNYFLLQAPESPEKASGITPQHIDNLLSIAIQDYDYVIMDLPRVVDAISMKVLDRSDKIYLVLQPIIPYIRAASKVLRLFTLLGYEASKISVISTREDSDKSISKSEIEAAIQKPIDWQFKNDFINCMESSNSGIPIEKLEPNSSFSKTLINLASHISGFTSAIPQKRPQSFFSKFFS
jgi:pilus assembly protein CpaE